MSNVELAFDEADLAERACHCRAALASAVTTTPALVGRVLSGLGITHRRLFALAGRVARDPDWTSGFDNPCMVVVRDCEDPRGRLGFWAEDGVLCMEMQLGDWTLVVRKGGTRLTSNRSLQSSVPRPTDWRRSGM